MKAEMFKYAMFCFIVSVSSLSHAAKKIASNFLPWGPLPQRAVVPPNNPQTVEKVHLGKQLFFDPRLSKDGTVSCNSCHNVMQSGGDSRPVSVGVGGKTGNRSSPTVWNAAFHTVQFWDGRAPTLEEQAKGPLTNPIEMAMENHDAVVDRVKALPGYVTQFRKVFKGSNPVNIDNIARAIAAYERTLITPDSPFDHYLRGDQNAISPQAKRGMNTVIEVGCITCHNGTNFNGPLASPGEGFFQKFPLFVENEYVSKYRLTEDKGRFAHTKNEEDENRWRVPTWRNVALTAPYFHNGSVPTLEEAVRVMAKVQLDKTLSDSQVADIVAFLNTLTGKFPEQKMPRLPDSPNTTFFVIDQFAHMNKSTDKLN